MADTRTLKLSLLADVNKFLAGMDKADKGTKSFSNSIGKYSKAMAKSFAVAGAAAGAYALKLGVDSVKAAAEDEAAAANLAKSLQNVVGATDATIASTEKFITSMQMATGISDNDLRKGMARLVRSTKDVAEAQKLSTLATNISAATGKDYTAVAEALAKANDGNTKALKRLGITLGENAINAGDLVAANKKLLKAQDDVLYAYDNFGPTSEEYVKAQEKVVVAQDKVNAITAEGVDWVGELSKEFAGSAAAKAKTFAGQLAILSQTFGELQEDVGAKMLPVLKRLFDQVLKVSRAFSGEDPDGLTARARELKGEVGDGSAGSLGRSIKILADSFANLFKAFSEDGDSTTDAMQEMADALNNIAKGINLVAGAYRGLKKLGAGALDLLDLGMGVGERFGPQGTDTTPLFNKSAATGVRPTAMGGTTIIMNGVIDGESARRSIEKVLQDSSRRTGAINLAGATL